MEKGYEVKSLFEPEQVNAVRQEIFSVFGRFGCKSDQDVMCLFRDDYGAFYGCAGLCQKLPSLWGLAISATKHLDMVHPVFNTKPLLMISSAYTAKSDAYWKIPAHQDWPSNLGSTNGVTVWVPLVDVDEELGPLEVSPGSHLLGSLEHEMNGVPVLKDYKGEFVSLPVKVGDAIIFSTMTVHRSGVNKSDRIRWSCAFRYNDAAEESFIKRKYPRNRTGE